MIKKAAARAGGSGRCGVVRCGAAGRGGDAMTGVTTAARGASVRGVVEGCVGGDPGAWAEFWGIVAGAVRGAIGNTLRFPGADRSLADDLGQEVFLHLRADGAARLRRFRGATEGELRAFVRVAAARMACQRLRRWRHARSRELAAARRAAGAARAGPTPAQIEAALRDLELSMSRSDRERLRRLRGGPSVGRHPGSPRAVRRLREELIRRYADHVG